MIWNEGGREGGGGGGDAVVIEDNSGEGERGDPCFSPAIPLISQSPLHPCLWLCDGLKGLDRAQAHTVDQGKIALDVHLHVITDPNLDLSGAPL